MGGGRHAGLLHQLLGEGLRSLQLGGRGARARRPAPPPPPAHRRRRRPAPPRARSRPGRRGARSPPRRSPRRLGADLRQALGVGRDPGVARRAEQLGRVGGARQRPHDRVLAPASADDQAFNAAPRATPARSSAGIAVSVWLVIVPREPSSTETLAIVFSSGASTMVTKSYWPSVAYWATHLGADLLDLLVHLGHPAGVVLQRPHALGGQVGQHQIGGHVALLSEG